MNFRLTFALVILMLVAGAVFFSAEPPGGNQDGHADEHRL